MRKHFLYILILIVLGSCTYQRNELVREGNKEYISSHMAEAQEKYLAAVQKDETFNVARFNLGDALYKNDKKAEAQEQFSIRTQQETDTTLKAYAFFNLGNTQLSRSILMGDLIEYTSRSIDSSYALVEAQLDIITRVRSSVALDSLFMVEDSITTLRDSLLFESIESYKQSLLLKHTQQHAKYNLAYAQLLLPKDDYDKMKKQKEEDEKKKQLTKLAIRFKKESDSLVDIYKFNDAKTKMEQGLKQDSSLKQYQDYVKKLNEITDIQK